MMHALVLNGAVMRLLDLDGDPPELAANKGRWLPLVAEADPTYDPLTQVLGAASDAVGADAVTRSRQVAAKPLADVKSEAVARVEAEFGRRIDVVGFPTGGAHVQIDAGSRANLGALALTAVLAQSNAVAWPDDYARGWITREGGRIALATPAEGIALAYGAGLHYAALVQAQADVLAAIDAAQDTAAVLAAEDW
jgi:hypothetical protein